MEIKLKKFGNILTSRLGGKEAFLVFKSILEDFKNTELIELDFSSISTLSPGWADEFLTPLLDMYGNRLVLKNTKNLSVEATLDFLQEIHKKKFKIL